MTFAGVGVFPSAARRACCGSASAGGAEVIALQRELVRALAAHGVDAGRTRLSPASDAGALALVATVGSRADVAAARQPTVLARQRGDVGDAVSRAGCCRPVRAYTALAHANLTGA